MPERIDQTGRRFGQLTVLSHIKGRHWLCQCDCGNQTSVSTSNFGKTKSCGCNKSPKMAGKDTLTLDIMDKLTFEDKTLRHWATVYNVPPKDLLKRLLTTGNLPA